MATFPFDTQDCSAELEVGKGRQFVELFAQDMEYVGEKNVMDYIITETKDYKKENKIVFKISLGRSLLSVILTTMLPTIILLLVTLSTNYYNKQHFKTIIPVNLTSLLSMVTLYVGMSARLPWGEPSQYQRRHGLCWTRAKGLLCRRFWWTNVIQFCKRPVVRDRDCVIWSRLCQ